MLIEAIYDNGHVVFPQQYRFAHNRFNIKVDVPDAEVVGSGDVTTDPALAMSSSIPVESAGSLADASEYPTDFLDFKRLQDAMFGSAYIYRTEKSDQEILAEVLSEKYA